MEQILNDAFEAFTKHSGWIVWNLFLAFIPLSLSFWLFRWGPKSRTTLWWIGLLVFVAFLPNAPYLLTDVIHLIQATREWYSVWIITLILIPLHLFAIMSGWQAYVISVMNQSSYLRRQGLSRAKTWWCEWGIHAICAIGVYLGRFRRFNSWDFVTQPDAIVVSIFDDFTSKRPIFVMFVTFVVLGVLYWITKQINLGLLLRFQYLRSGAHEQDGKI